tara:strand:- start:530 stop:694 length:165 start_codon:yes stop_codon:yes gene_type:complete
MIQSQLTNGSEVQYTNNKEWGTFIVIEDSYGFALKGDRGEKAFDVCDISLIELV